MTDLDASPEAVAEIDRLAGIARRSPHDSAATDALWRAALDLDRWILVARGDEEQPMPYAITAPDGPMLLVFTTAERARAAALATGLGDEAARRLLAVPLPAAVDWAATLQGVGMVALALDHGVVSARARLSDVVAMRDRLAANPAR